MTIKYINTLALTSTFLIIASTQAAYISPTEYKNHSCNELQEDYLGYLDASLKNLSEEINAFGTKRADSLKDNGEELRAHITAIEKASKRKDCPVKTPKELADSK